MPRSCPAINGVRLLSAPSPADSGGTITQTATYSVGWYTPGTPPAFQDAPPLAPFRLGTGSVSVSLPDTTSPLYRALLGALLTAIKAAEGLSTGDTCILADGVTTVALP